MIIEVCHWLKPLRKVSIVITKPSPWMCMSCRSKYESGFSYFATSLWPLIWSLLLLLISEIFLDVLEVKYTQIIYFARYFSISCQEFIYNFTIKVLHGAEFLPYPDFMRYDDILTTTFLEAWFRARQNAKKKNWTIWKSLYSTLEVGSMRTIVSLFAIEDDFETVIRFNSCSLVLSTMSLFSRYLNNR